MKTIEFPTIHQMMDAIGFTFNTYDCRYDEVNHQFIAVELLPIPHRDSGGSIDCTDFECSECVITFKRAYEIWVDLNNFMNNQVIVAHEPVSPIEIDSIVDFEDDLPF